MSFGSVESGPGISNASTTESGLQVLSRVANMVENSSQPQDTTGSSEPMDTSTGSSAGTTPASVQRSPSFKERHPKFRKNSTPDYMVAADARRNGHQAVQQSPPSPSPVIPVVFPPEQQIIHTDEDSNVDVVNESTEDMPEGPIDLSAKKSRSPTPPPAYRFTPLTLKGGSASTVAPPPPAYNSRPPPPPYPVSKSPPITSTTPPKLDSRNFEQVRAQLAVAAVAAAQAGGGCRAPPPSYSQATVKAFPSQPSSKKVLNFGLPPSSTHQNVDSNNVSTTTPLLNRIPKGGSKKGLSASPPDERPVREITIITDSSADPLLDEHFRRSLGEQKYRSLFNEDKQPAVRTSPPPPARTAPSPTSSSSAASSAKVSPKSVDPVKAFHDDMESEGYTVEDHFAKALGETWVKLQAKAEQDAKAKAEAKVTSTTSEARVTVK